MAALFPNPKPFSLHSLPDSRNLRPYSFPRFTLAIDSEKPLRASSISSRPRRECGVIFASRWRSRTASTSGALVHDDVKEDWDDEEEEKEEEGDEEFVPLREMTRWLQNKPAGFGEGKAYDTTVEDKILEELERSRKNQLEEKRKPRISAKENAGTFKKQMKQNVTDAIKCDTEVRVGNLPKKKNIDRDLWKAFKEISGITNISPAVTGNKKTRDPICRGFAIVGFESNDAAHRFVQKCSNQNLLFGKVQKQISCDIVNGNNAVKSATSFNAAEHRDNMFMPCTLEIIESANDIPLAGKNKEDFTVLPPNDTTVSLSAHEASGIAIAFENSSLSCSDIIEGDNVVNKKDPRTESPMPCDQIRNKIAAKREKTKSAKFSKPRVLGSLARLKIKERAVLTGVFSKYGEITLPASKELS